MFGKIRDWFRGVIAEETRRAFRTFEDGLKIALVNDTYDVFATERAKLEADLQEVRATLSTIKAEPPSLWRESPIKAVPYLWASAEEIAEINERLGRQGNCRDQRTEIVK